MKNMVMNMSVCSFSIRHMIFAALMFSVGVLFAADEEYGKGTDVSLTGNAILIKENTLFITIGSESFAKSKALCSVDIGKEDSPKLLSTLPLKGFPQDMVIAGDKLYLVNGKSLLVIDIAQASELKIIGELEISSDPLKGPTGVDLKGNYAFLACRNAGLKVVNVADPKKLELVASLETGGFSRGIAIHSTFAYLAEDAKGITVINIENPGKPAKEASLKSKLGTAARIRFNGDNAFVAEGFSQVEVLSWPADGKNFKRTGGISTLKSLNFYGTYCYDIAFDASPAAYAFLADGESGVVVLDIKDVNEPKCVGKCEGLLWHTIKSLVPKGKYLYVNDEGFGLRLLDISNPLKPTIIGEGLQLTK